MKNLLAAVSALGFVYAAGPAIAQEAAVMDGPVLHAVGTVISVGNTALAIETQEHGHPVSFLITTTTVLPASVPLGSRVDVAYHAVGVSTQVADRVVLLDAPPPSASAGEAQTPDPAASPRARHAEPRASSTERPGAPRTQLPATASPLPLIGLVGLVTLAGCVPLRLLERARR